ncbi:hypothetical protein GWI68_07220 [Proteus sp. G2669]|uniref:phage tail fiber protein n=1 Tax=Proteus sp. G2669 TaxID=2698881 RepID=UPI001411EF7B|nr:hypothetical protein [Proteus sp. G2669]NBM54585.1 hypothetical protein [Proteus sp. G2669]
MIYTTGTVNTVSGSAIVRGTGTKFKNNNPAINIGMTILIKSGTTNIPYMIKSVNSDTELVLAQPALATATNTAFSIHITEPDNNSDAARTMVAINSYAQYFLDAMNTWMSETGQTKIEMPNGEVVTLDSIKKIQSDIADRIKYSDTYDYGQNAYRNAKIARQYFYDLRDISTQNSLWSYAPGVSCGLANEKILGISEYLKQVGVITSRGWSEKSGAGAIFQICASADGAWLRSSYAGADKFNSPVQFLMAGNFGVGGMAPSMSNNDLKTSQLSSLFKMGGGTDNNQFTNHGCGIHFVYSATIRSGLFVNASTGVTYSYTSDDRDANGIVRTRILYSTANTTVDSNGFIKRASPVININPDGTFTTNDESDGATVTRVAQGEYLIEGVLGFNADAGWGGIDGGIEIPLDVNKQPLIWVNSKVNKDGSILVKTYHRTHPNAPEFANNKIDGFNDGDPIDIPAGRFISVRVQMPEGSIYNVRMREMEEGQKAEEERRQKEEEMKAQFGLGENDVLL